MVYIILLNIFDLPFGNTQNCTSTISVWVCPTHCTFPKETQILFFEENIQITELDTTSLDINTTNNSYHLLNVFSKKAYIFP